jgi:hypothetical protein
MRKLIRLEWVSVLYLVLFVLAVLTPRVITHDWYGLEEAQIEEVLIFFFGMTGLVSFSLYERLMEWWVKEKEVAERERDTARKELVSSYEYIGSMNRQIDALKRVANQTAASVVSHDDTAHKELFQSLAASAATLAGSRHATIRMVALDRLRTIHEYHADPQLPLRVPNKALQRSQEEQRSLTTVRGEHGKDVLIIPSDRTPSPAKTFILVAAPAHAINASDTDLLRVYANQAELLFHALSQKDRPSIDSLALVREAERRVVGQVS